MLAILLAPVYLLVNGYVLIRSLKWLRACLGIFHSKGFQIGYAVIYGLMCTSLLSAFLLPAGDMQAAVKSFSNVWLGMFLYILLFVGMADLIKIILKHFQLLPKRVFHSRKWFALTGSLVAAAVITVSVYGFLHEKDIRITEYDIAVEKDWPKGECNIVLAADLHLGYSIGTEQMRRMVERINACEADLVCLAGDIFDNEYEALDDPDELIRILSGIRSRYGVYACYGNHDVEERVLGGFTFRDGKRKMSDPRMDAFLEKAGIQLLQDEIVCIGDSFYLAGRLDYAKPGRTALTRKTPEELLDGLESEKPVIVMDHQPRELSELAAAGADVDLSGHTHDGQLFPGNLITRLFWENSYGYTKVGTMHSVVTSGVGVFGPAMRVGTNSEIVNIRLRGVIS